MQGDKRIDELMLPVLNAINRHVKDRDAKTDIYNRAYEAVINSMDAKLKIENAHLKVSRANLHKAVSDFITFIKDGENAKARIQMLIVEIQLEEIENEESN